MKTIVEALKDLYVALGGKEQDVANLLLNPDVIEKIAAVAGDAVKPELPALTGNAGKVLKVDADAEGVEWGEAGGGGGGLTLYGPYYASPNEGTTIASGEGALFELHNITDINENSVSFPSTGAIYLPLGVWNQGMGSTIQYFLGPEFYGEGTSDPVVLIRNNTESSIVFDVTDVNMEFYSTVELQPATP